MGKSTVKRIERKRTRKFKYSGPACKGDAYPLFDNGQCYRVEAKNKWYLYNDTLDREVQVIVTFDAANGAKGPKKGRTELKKVGRSQQCKLTVYPLETIKFVNFKKKKAEGYRLNTLSLGLTQGYIEKVNREARASCAKQMQRVSSIAAQTHNDEELMYKCRKSNIPFVDFSFKPTETSLQRPQDKKKVQNLAKITWKRPEDYIPEEAHDHVKLYSNGIYPDDIEQGNLGDCWLMCSIAVVAESKTMIKDIFRHPVSKSKQKKEQKAGAYRVYLNKTGWWHNVIVDNYFPTYNCAVYFGRSSEDPFELWVSLLEKAYAKMHGSYANIIGGNALQALQDLTGFPVYSFEEVWNVAAREEDKAKEFFKDLLRFHKKGYLISLSTPGSDTSSYNAGNGATNSAAFQQKYEKAGLGMGHAYSVLRVEQFYMPNIKLLQIRNPWGTGTEWTGDFGKNSSRWKSHPFVKRACKPSSKSDGTFWMEWKDVVKYFDGGGVCMVKKKWFDYRFPGQFVDIHPSFCLKVEIKKKQRFFFTLSQKDRRTLDANDPEALYKGFLIAVCGTNPDTLQQEVIAISSANPESHPADVFTFTVRRDVSIEIELDADHSPYYIVPRIMVANRSGPKEFTMAMMTPNKASKKSPAVSFVRLPDTCPLFKNVKTFSAEGEKPVELQFQFKKRGSVPRLRDGINVHESKEVDEIYPFPVKKGLCS